MKKEKDLDKIYEYANEAFKIDPSSEQVSKTLLASMLQVEQSFASTSDGAGMTGEAGAAAVVGNTSKYDSVYRQKYEQKEAESNQLINYTMKLSNEYETLKAENDGKDVSELRKELKESQEQSAKLRKELESARGDGSGKDAAGRQKRSRSKGGINLEIWELALLIVVVAIVFRYYV